MSTFDNKTQDVGNLTQVAHADSVTTTHIHHYAAAEPEAIITPIRVLPPIKPKLHPIVGRDDAVEKLLAALAGGERVVALVHLPGVGKTTLADLLVNHPVVKEVLFPDGVLWAHLGRNPDLRGQLRKWALALGVPETRMKDFNTPLDWAEAVKAAIGERRLLLVIDDVWDVDTAKAWAKPEACDENWDIDAAELFLLGGENCAHVVTTRYATLAERIAREPLEVRKLGDAAALKLLTSIAHKAVNADPAAARELVSKVDGLPLALVLMGHYLKQEGTRDNPQRIRAALNALQDVAARFQLVLPPEYPSDTPRSLAYAVETSFDALGSEDRMKLGPGLSGEQLRDALKRVSILRPDPARFTRELAEGKLGVAPGALDALGDAGLVEVLQIPPQTDDRSGGERFMIHRTIAEYIRQKLNEDELRAGCLSAADFYREKLITLEEAYQASPTDYGRWYRYEDLDWQDCKDNWLYYLARGGDYERVAFAFVRAWFDAFWWWGCFLEFGFCDQLLREWRERTSRPESERGLQLLTEFKACYPKETEDRSGGNWTRIAAVLEEIRTRMGLDGDPTTLDDEERRHLRAFTSLFLAESRRFGARDYAAAEAYYREALALFRINDDDWDCAWALYHLASCLLDAGRPTEAAALCEQAAALGRAQDDPEVLALIEHVKGEIALTRGDLQAMADHYHAAVFDAYRFQIEPLAPDPYTVRFYTLISVRVAGGIVRLAASMPEAAHTVAHALQERWRAHVDAPGATPATLDMGNAEALAQALFPPGLAEADLGNIGAYTDHAHAVIKRVTQMRAALNARPTPTPG